MVRSPQNHLLRFNIPNPSNLFLQSLGSPSKVLFELYQKHFPHLPPGGRWIHFLESDPDPALPEVVMQRKPLWPRLEFSTLDADSDTAQFSPVTRCRDFHLTKELANPNWFQGPRDWQFTKPDTEGERTPWFGTFRLAGEPGDFK